MKKVNVKSIIKIIFLVIVVVCIFISIKYFNVQSELRKILLWIQNSGWIGIAVYIGIYIIACIFFIPGSLLTLGAGAVFGVVQGSIFTSIASTLGATVSFLVGRYLARDWINKKIQNNKKFSKVDEAVGKEGWKIVILTRLSPIFPFNLLNYAYGLTKVALKNYFFASWIGMMPGTIMYVYIGSIAGNIATIGSQGRNKTTAEWILYSVGLLATIVVTLYITKISKNALSKKINNI